LSINKKILEEIVENTLNSLKKSGFIVESISYPENKRSIDIIGLYRGVRLIIKASIDTSHVTDVEINDLKKVADAYEATPLIVSRKHGKKELEPDVVYRRKGINVVKDEALETIFIKGEKPYVYDIQGTYVLRLNPEKFRQRRLELGYSLGDTASLLGVSRKAVYEYEHGKRSVSIETAIRIAEIFGEDVFEPIDLLKREDIKPPEDEPQSTVEQAIYSIAIQKGYRFYRLLRTPIDYVLRSEKNSLSIIYKGEDTRKFGFKIREAERIARTLNTKQLIVKDRKDAEELREFID